MNTQTWRPSVLRGLLCVALASCSTAPAPEVPPPVHDVVLRGGTIYDGSGGAPYVGDVTIDGDRISAVEAIAAGGRSLRPRGRIELDVSGRAVSPGFINMLSWADESLLVDGRSLSDIHQGVTLEVFGEGSSMGPLSPAMRERLLAGQTDLRFEVPWTTLGGYLEHLEQQGVSPNVASFVGATTVRVHEIGYDDRPASPAELERMRALVDQAMREGALGVGSSLPYTPAVFAPASELVALAEVAARHGGMYISHVRDEGGRLLESLEEFLDIVRQSGASGEVYHLKASGKANWTKGELAIARLEQARAEGLRVTANVYPYAASSTGLTYALPAWVLEGEPEERYARLADPAIRARVIPEMTLIPPGDLMLVSFRNPALRRYVGKTLAEVAAERGTSPEVTALDLLVEDRSRIGTVRFTMSEENVRRNVALPWVAFGSDGGSIAPEPPFTHSQPHPRTYGTFARVLGRYVREEKLLSLAEAVRRMTSFPAENLKLDRRGRLAPGYFADVVVFDPDAIADRATFESPHQLAVGVEQLFVNGTAVIRDGIHTGAKPGRAVRGPGYRGATPGAVSAPSTGAAPPTAALPEVAAAIAVADLWIREQLAYHGIPGLAVAVVHDGETLWTAGYGSADLSTGLPVTPHTRFRLGSVSKLFTATAVLMLRDEGKLRLEEPVDRYLPWFAVKNPFDGGPRVTLEQLLTHTSGLPREAPFSYWTTHVFPSRQELRTSLAGLSLLSRPGETYRYSNLGVALLGEVVAAVSGENWSTFIERRILSPLAMSSSLAELAPADFPTLAGAYLRKRPDGSRGTATPYTTEALAPASSVVSTASDLARFAAFHLTSTEDQGTGGQALLAAATRREMQRARFVYPGWSGGRGLGFAVTRRGDRTFPSHGGWIGGHRSDLILDPERDIAVVVLTNADDASPAMFSRKLLDLFGGALSRAMTLTPAAKSPEPAWQRYLGVYTDPWEWEYEVLILDGGLVLYEHSYPPEDEPEAAISRLTPTGPGAFRMADGEPVVFDTDASGKVIRLRRRFEILTPKPSDRSPGAGKAAEASP